MVSHTHSGPRFLLGTSRSGAHVPEEDPQRPVGNRIIRVNGCTVEAWKP